MTRQNRLFTTVICCVLTVAHLLSAIETSKPHSQIGDTTSLGETATQPIGRGQTYRGKLKPATDIPLEVQVWGEPVSPQGRKDLEAMEAGASQIEKRERIPLVWKRNAASTDEQQAVVTAHSIRFDASGSRLAAKLLLNCFTGVAGKYGTRIFLIDAGGKTVASQEKQFLVTRDAPYYVPLWLPVTQDFTFAKLNNAVAFEIALGPVASGTAPAPTGPAPGGASTLLATAVGFGPAAEKVVNAPEAGSDTFLDLETGRLLAYEDGNLPDEPTMSKELSRVYRRSRWAKGSGADICLPPDGRFDKDVTGLIGLDMREVAAQEPFDQLTPQDAAKALADRTFYMLGEMRCRVSDLPATFVLETREGHVAVVQVAAVADKPAGLKIRYKIASVPVDMGPEAPLWITLAPAEETIRSIKELSVHAAARNLNQEAARSGEWEIRTADNAKRVARFLYPWYISQDQLLPGGKRILGGTERQGRFTLDEQQLRTVGGLDDGNYLLAWYVGGKRASNVIRFRIDAKYDANTEPLLKLTEIEPGPNHGLPSLILRAYRHAEGDPAPRASDIAFATLNIDGQDRTLAGFAWAGNDAPLAVGGHYSYILNLAHYVWNPELKRKEPPLDPDTTHTIIAKVGSQKSEPVRLTYFPYLGEAWDKATAKLAPVSPPTVVLSGLAIGADGKPAPEYEVTLTVEGGTDRFRANANAAGRYEFVGIPAGTYRLGCNPPRMGQPAVVFGGVVIEPGKTRKMELSLAPKVTLTGLIADEDGKPLANVPVAITCADRQSRGEFTDSTQTDNQGHYRLGSPLGEVTYVGVNGGRVDGEMPKLKPGPNQADYAFRRVMGRLRAAPTAHRGVAWGKAVNGLESGLCFAMQDRAYKMGETVDFVLLVRNNVDKAIMLVDYVPLTGLAPTIRPVGGKPLLVSIPAVDQPVQMRKSVLKPGDILEVGTVSLRLDAGPEERGQGPHVYLTPGKYLAGQTYRFENGVGSTWSGELVTGEMALSVVASDQASQPATAPTSSPSAGIAPAKGETAQPAARAASIVSAPNTASAEQPRMELKMSFNQDFYFPTEDIPATVTFSTDSSKPVYVSQASPMVEGSRLSFEVKDQTGKSLEYKGRQGGSASIRHQFSKGMPAAAIHELGKMYQLDQAGDYEVRAIYRDWQDGDAQIKSAPAKFRVVKPDSEKLIDSRIGSDPWKTLCELVQFTYKDQTYFLVRQYGAQRSVPNVRGVAHCRRIEGVKLENGKIVEATMETGDRSCWLISLPNDNTLAVVLDEPDGIYWRTISRKAQELKLKREDGEPYAPFFIEDTDGKRLEIRAREPAAAQPAAETRPEAERFLWVHLSSSEARAAKIARRVDMERWPKGKSLRAGVLMDKSLLSRPELVTRGSNGFGTDLFRGGLWGSQDWGVDRLVGGRLEGELRVQIYLTPDPRAAHELCMVRATGTQLPTEASVYRYSRPDTQALVGDLSFGMDGPARGVAKIVEFFRDNVFVRIDGRDAFMEDVAPLAVKLDKLIQSRATLDYEQLLSRRPRLAFAPFDPAFKTPNGGGPALGYTATAPVGQKVVDVRAKVDGSYAGAANGRIALGTQPARTVELWVVTDELLAARVAVENEPAYSTPATQAEENVGVNEQSAAAFETFRVEMKSFWAWNRTLTVRSDGTYTFEMQTLEKVPGEKQLQPSKTPYIASYRLSPGDLRELTQLLKATRWLAEPASPGPMAIDSTEYAMTMTLSHDAKLVQRTYHEEDKVPAYVDVVRFLRRINRQEDLLFAVTHRDQPFPGDSNLGDELDAVMGVGSRAKPYSPALDYHRLVPAYAEFLVSPKMSPRLSADAAKLMGYLKLESQRKNLEALALGRIPDEPSYAIPADLRKAAVNALAMMGAGESLDALKTAGQAEDTWLRDAVAEALLTAPSDKAIPILKELANKSQNAAWTLIRLGRQAEADIVDLLYQPGGEEAGGRAAYLLIRAYADHWKELPSPPSAAILTAVHDRVRSVGGSDGSLVGKYGLQVLKLTDDPFVVRNAWQDLDATMSLMAAKDQQARKELLLPMHFRNNRAPGAFLKDAQAGTLGIRRVMVEGTSGWAHVAEPKGQTTYALYLSRNGVVWVIEAAQAVPGDGVQTHLDGFLRNHAQANEVTVDASSPEADLNARNDQAVGRVVERIMAAIRDKDVETLKRLSAGSALGWLSPAEAKGLTGRLPAGWSAQRLAEVVKELHDTYAANLNLMRDVQALQVRGDWAAAHLTGPEGKLAGPRLLVVLQRTPQGWRLLDVGEPKGALPEDLERRADQLGKLQDELFHRREVQAKEAAVAK